MKPVMDLVRTNFEDITLTMCHCSAVYNYFIGQVDGVKYGFLAMSFELQELCFDASRKC